MHVVFVLQAPFPLLFLSSS